MTDHGRYRVLRKIADGGMAEIFLGTQRGAVGFERLVVLKRIRPDFVADVAFRDALIDEAHIAMSLHHSNIAQVLDLGVAAGNTFLVLEFVDGWDLDRLLRRSDKTGLSLPPELALYLVGETCRALGYAHSRTRDGKSLGIVHRDVTPHNILVSEQGEVKLTDFGIATARTKRGVSQIGTVKGKIGFMSPEQASGGALDARSDLYTLGTTLYLMTTGKRPFAGDSDAKTLAATRKGEFAPPEVLTPGVSPEVSRLIKRAMMRDPNERYRSAEEMLLDVEAVQRTALRPAGQTELKRWLVELALADGAVPIGRAPPPALKTKPGQAPEAPDLAPIPSAEAELVLEVAEPSGKHPALVMPPPSPRRSAEAPTVAFAPGASAPAADSRLATHAARPAEEPTIAIAPGSAPPEVRASARVGTSEAEPREQANRGHQPFYVAAAVVVGMAVIIWSFAAPDRPPKEAAPAAPDAAVAVANAAPDAAEAVAVGVAAEEGVDAGSAEPAGSSESPGVRLVIARRAPPPEAGDDVVYVQLASVPPGARVHVDGKSYGETPGGLRCKALLSYDVEFVKDGFAPQKARVYVPRRNGQVIEAVLAPRL